jgi:Txe/YoeB family toxin of Txe-Axe toxin-antitoxin module
MAKSIYFSAGKYPSSGRPTGEVNAITQQDFKTKQEWDACDNYLVFQLKDAETVKNAAQIIVQIDRKGWTAWNKNNKIVNSY